MTDEEVLERIQMLRRRGTDLEDLEAKRAEKAIPKRLWETLSAFANQRGGGVVILGLHESESFRVVGVQDVKKVQDDLASMCDQMEPVLRPLIRVHDVEGKQLIVVEVQEVDPNQKPCFYRGSGLYTGSFIRVGDGDRQMTQYEVHQMLEIRSPRNHDLEPVPETNISDLDPDLIQVFLRRVRQRRIRLTSFTDERILKVLHVLTKEGEVTLAGWLCFAPFPQERFPELTLAFVHYPGTLTDSQGIGGIRFLDNRRFDGPLPHALEDALKTLIGAMKKRNLIQGLYRQEIPEYPPEAIREAIVNAIAHRDYSAMSRGTQVQIQMFQDRLEIRNPGGLFGPVNEDNLGEPGIQAARNSFLGQLLEDLGPAENRGSGIPTILREVRLSQMSPPELSDERTFFRVTFANDTMLDDATIAWLNHFSKLSLDENQRLALAYTLHQERISNPVYRHLTGADSQIARSHLHRLVEMGLLQQDGTGRWTTYRLTVSAENAGETEIPESIPPLEREERILRCLREKAPRSAKQIAVETGIPHSTTKRTLKDLVTRGLVESTSAHGKDPTTGYRLISIPERATDS